jgi:Universal stress protein family
LRIRGARVGCGKHATGQRVRGCGFDLHSTTIGVGAAVPRGRHDEEDLWTMPRFSSATTVRNPRGQLFALRPDFSVRAPRSCSTWRPCSHLRSVTPSQPRLPARSNSSTSTPRKPSSGRPRARTSHAQRDSRRPRGARSPPRRGRGILDVAEETRASVIVIGSHGRTGVREFVEGSVSHDLAQHSSLPVLVVPPQARRDR